MQQIRGQELALNQAYLVLLFKLAQQGSILNLGVFIEENHFAPHGKNLLCRRNTAPSCSQNQNFLLVHLRPFNLFEIPFPVLVISAKPNLLPFRPANIFP